MSASDPSQVDTATLKASLARDLKEAQYAAVREDWATTLRWTREASATIAELGRRSHLSLVPAAKPQSDFAKQQAAWPYG